MSPLFSSKGQNRPCNPSGVTEVRCVPSESKESSVSLPELQKSTLLESQKLGEKNVPKLNLAVVFDLPGSGLRVPTSIGKNKNTLSHMFPNK